MVATAKSWGVLLDYRIKGGRRRRAAPETIAPALAALGADPGSSPPRLPTRVVTMGREPGLIAPGRLRLEDGSELTVERRLPAGLPLGYHRLSRDGNETMLIVCPAGCHLPADLFSWGWAVQLYALRSKESWGMGDLADLQAFGRWAAASGAGMVCLNPLVAPAPVIPQEPSPYYPSSRLFLNPLYLRIEQVPGWRDGGLATVAAAGRELNTARQIDRDRVFELKRRALLVLWKRFPGDAGFEQFTGAGGRLLEDFATHCAITEEHGPNWRRWPAALRHPRGSEVTAYRSAHRDRVRFHQWLQWMADDQLRRAAAEVPLVADLPVGADPGGADAWIWQDLLAPDVSIGSPPDDFNPEGQDWQLPAFDPWKLNAGGYEPFVQALRASFRHSAGIRIDHVMGLFRLYWMPRRAPQGTGVYVRYPSRDLLSILALESVRASAWVLGEDLGTVDPAMRTELRRRQILSYSLLWFQSRSPERYPAASLAAVGTHDLPTLHGLWSGSDRMGAGDDGVRRRVARLAGRHSGSVTSAVYSALAAAPSRLLSATLDDALAVRERVNTPGDQQAPNWKLALPASLEQVRSDPRVTALADLLTEARETLSGRQPGDDVREDVHDLLAHRHQDHDHDD
jgi:4-alpha-glucanotransferase